MKWTEEKVIELRKLYPKHTNREIAAITGWNYSDVMHKGKNLRIKKEQLVRSRAAGVTPWTEDQITFLRANFRTLTNRELASDLGYKITVVRNKTRELSLQKFQPMEKDFIAAYQIVCPCCKVKQTGIVRASIGEIQTLPYHYNEEVVSYSHQVTEGAPFILCSLISCQHLIVNDELAEATRRVVKSPSDFRS